MSEKVLILNSTGNRKVAMIYFEREKEEKIKERLKYAGFDVEVRKVDY